MNRPDPSNDNQSLLSLAPNVHSNPQLRAIRARLANAKNAQGVNQEEKPRLMKERENSVGAGYQHF